MKPSPPPDFLCIGAQKAGTTWLDRNLRCHPDLWLPPLKELHYFDFMSRPHIFDIFSARPRLRRWTRNRIKVAIRSSLANWRIAPWYLHFFLAYHTDSWYCDLFQPSGDRLSGEVTPNYARLDDSVVAQVYALAPNARIIYLLRDPVQRLWSQVCMRFKRDRRKIENASVQEKLAYCQMKNPQANSAYAANLTRWQKWYGSEQIFIGFYEDLCHDPAGLLAEVYRFLGVTVRPEYFPETVVDQVNAGHNPLMPSEVEKHLAKSLRDQIAELYAMLEHPYVAQWLARADKALEMRNQS